MTTLPASRQIRNRVALRWALLGAITALLLSGWLVWLVNFSRLALLAGSLSVVSGAAVGALLAAVYQVVGRAWFWVIALVLGLAGLALGVARGPGHSLPWLAPLILAVALTLWVLSAYALSVLRRRWSARL